MRKGVGKYVVLKYTLFSLLTTLAFVATVEVSSRVYFSIKYPERKDYYLWMGFNGKSKKIEIYDRVRHTPYEGYYKGVPGDYVQRYGSREFPVRINSLGFRGRDFSEKRAPDTYRIFCLGGSSTEALEVEDGRDYPSILEKKLNAGKLPFKAQVINAGFLGADSNHIAALFSNEIVNYTPNMIIIYSGYNDYHKVIDGGGVITGFFGRTAFKVLSIFHNLLYVKSVFYTAAWEKVLIYNNKTFDKIAFNNMLKKYAENLKKIIREAKAKRIEVILTKQAIHIEGLYKKNSQGVIRVIKDKLKQGAPLPREEAYYYSDYMVKDIANKIAEEASIKMVDVSSGLMELEPSTIFYDAVHLTERGNMGVADSLAGFLIKHLEVNIQKPIANNAVF